MQMGGVIEQVVNDQHHTNFMELMGYVWWLGEFIAVQGGLNLLPIIQEYPKLHWLYK